MRADPVHCHRGRAFPTTAVGEGELATMLKVACCMKSLETCGKHMTKEEKNSRPLRKTVTKPLTKPLMQAGFFCNMEAKVTGNRTWKQSLVFADFVFIQDFSLQHRHRAFKSRTSWESPACCESCSGWEKDVRWRQGTGRS